jgi:hypothetical protein
MDIYRPANIPPPAPPVIFAARIAADERNPHDNEWPDTIGRETASPHMFRLRKASALAQRPDIADFIRDYLEAALASPEDAIAYNKAVWKTMNNTAPAGVPYENAKSAVDSLIRRGGDLEARALMQASEALRPFVRQRLQSLMRNKAGQLRRRMPMATPFPSVAQTLALAADDMRLYENKAMDEIRNIYQANSTQPLGITYHLLLERLRRGHATYPHLDALLKAVPLTCERPSYTGILQIGRGLQYSTIDPEPGTILIKAPYFIDHGFSGRFADDKFRGVIVSRQSDTIYYYQVDDEPWRPMPYLSTPRIESFKVQQASEAIKQAQRIRSSSSSIKKRAGAAEAANLEKSRRARTAS